MTKNKVKGKKGDTISYGTVWRKP